MLWNQAQEIEGYLEKNLGISSTDMKGKENRQWEDLNKFLRWRGKKVRDFSRSTLKCSRR